MTKLSYSNIDLSREVLPSVMSTIDRLQDLIAVNNSMYIPGGFQYSGFLNEYADFIVDSKNKFKDIEDWINKSNREYGNDIDHINDDLNNIPIENVLERGNSVK